MTRLSRSVPHELEADAQMVSEVEVVQHVDDVVDAILVLGSEMVQDAHLDQSLMMEPLLVANDLDGHVLIGAVIQSSYHLTETSFANDF